MLYPPISIYFRVIHGLVKGHRVLMPCITQKVSIF